MSEPVVMDTLFVGHTAAGQGLSYQLERSQPKALSSCHRALPGHRSAPATTLLPGPSLAAHPTTTQLVSYQCLQIICHMLQV